MTIVQEILPRLKEALREQYAADLAYSAFEQEEIRRDAARAKKMALIHEAEARSNTAFVEEIEAQCAETANPSSHALSEYRAKATLKRMQADKALQKLWSERNQLPSRTYDSKPLCRQHEATKSVSAVKKELRIAMTDEVLGGR